MTFLALALSSRPCTALANERTEATQYRGRSPPVRPRDVALWIPRVVLAPLYAFTDGVVRRPILAVAAFAEEHHVVPKLHRVFVPSREFSWTPTLRIDAGLLPWVGARLRYAPWFVPGTELRAGTSTGGPEAWHLYVEHAAGGPTLAFASRADFVTRPDDVFYGLGPRSASSDKSFVRLTRGELRLSLDAHAGPHLALNVAGAFRGELTTRGLYPFVGDRFQPSETPGLGSLSLAIASASVRIDSRRREDQTEGAWLAINARYATDPNDARLAFVQTEAEGDAAIGLGTATRVLEVNLYAADTTLLGSAPVPFVELESLGGTRHLGFLAGRFVDQSALLATLAYRMPIWAQLEIAAVASAGNVFDTHFDGFDARLLTASAGVVVRSRLAGGEVLATTFALGSRRFDEPFGIDGVRFLLTFGGDP